MSSAQIEPWATLRVRLQGAARDRAQLHESARKLDEIAALLACLPAVGGVETRDPATLGGIERSELILYTVPDALATLESRTRELAIAFDLDVRLDAQVRTDDDWRDAWKTFYAATVLGRGVLGDGALLLRPSWIPRKDDDPEREIVIDPGRAFGTGLHETTRLVLDRLCALASSTPHDAPGPRAVLDLGCGSGILALVAARLFPRADLVACDVDPEATETTRENAELNHLRSRVEIVTGDLDAVAHLGPFGLVLANIRAETLVPRAAAVAALLEPTGRLVLSGILDHEAADVRAAYHDVGLVDDGEGLRHAEGWIALDLVAP